MRRVSSVTSQPYLTRRLSFALAGLSGVGSAQRLPAAGILIWLPTIFIPRFALRKLRPPSVRPAFHNANRLTGRQKVGMLPRLSTITSTMSSDVWEWCQ